MLQLKAKAKLITPLWHSQCVGFNYSCEQQYEHCKHLYRLFGSPSRGSCSSSFIASATQSGSSIIFFLAFINYPVTKLLKQRIGNVFSLLGRLNPSLFLTPNLCMLDVWRSPREHLSWSIWAHFLVIRLQISNNNPITSHLSVCWYVLLTSCGDKMRAICARRRFHTPVHVWLLLVFPSGTLANHHRAGASPFLPAWF